MTNSCGNNSSCTNQFGCSPDDSGICPDFIIKRYDTRPVFQINVTDCGDPLDLTNTVVEVSIWAKAKLKAAIGATDEYFALADNIGFPQVAVGDIIVSNRPRNPEQMLIVGFDEDNYLVQVLRGYNGSPAASLPKGHKLRIFRTLNGIGTTQMTLVDVPQPDGAIEKDVVSESKLIYEWVANDTCLPGCFYLELKLLKMINTGSTDTVISDDGINTDANFPSIISITYPNDEGCDRDWHDRDNFPYPRCSNFEPLKPPVGENVVFDLVSITTSLIPCNLPSATPISFVSTVEPCSIGTGVLWARRFPSDCEGYLIKIIDTGTSEQLT